MKSNSKSQAPSTSLVIGAVIMVVLPFIIGIGLIGMLVMNRNAQIEALPTLVNTQVQAPTEITLVPASTSIMDVAVTATPATNPASTGVPATTSTANPTGTAVVQVTATIQPATSGGNSAGATNTPLPPTANNGGTVTPSATIASNNTPTGTITQLPSTASPTATATQTGVGIVVSTPRWYYDAELNIVRVVGEVTNNTTTQQLIETVSGIFYSAPGVTVPTDSIIEFAPQEVIPVGGTVPFYFELDALSSLSSFTVTVQTDLSPFVTRMDLILQEQSERTDDAGQRCFDGKVRNSGERLQTEIVILANIYDEQNNLVNFDYQTFAGTPAFEVFGDRMRSYSVCIRPPHNGRADVRVYGR